MKSLSEGIRAMRSTARGAVRRDLMRSVLGGWSVRGERGKVDEGEDWVGKVRARGERRERRRIEECILVGL